MRVCRRGQIEVIHEWLDVQGVVCGVVDRQRQRRAREDDIWARRT